MLLVWSAIDEMTHFSGEQKIDNPHTDGLESQCRTRQWAKIIPAISLTQDCSCTRVTASNSYMNILQDGASFARGDTVH
jgi:hypothetical protein